MSESPPRDRGRWPKGFAPNPLGSSQKKRFAALLKRRIKERGADPELVDTWIDMALGKHPACDGLPQFAWFREMLDRIDGPVNSKIDIGSNGTPARVKIVYDDRDPRSETQAETNGRSRIESPDAPPGPDSDPPRDA